MRDPLAIDRLLNKLCVDMGLCLAPIEYERLVHDAPTNVKAFVDAVFLAEGLDPATVDRRVYRGVRDIVAKAFRDAEDVA
jgi:hypothetical protein